jgi:uncharacterized protein YfdQ (DUF2303 family)
MSETPRFGDIADSGSVAAAIAAGVTLAEPSAVGDGLYSVLVPAGARHELVDVNDLLERLELTPKRAKGTVAPQTVDDFARYVTRHDDTDRTTIWVDADGRAVTAVLNDHAGTTSDAGWGDHRAQLRLKLTPEWQRWASHDAAYLDQEAFAEHIELGLPEIVQPDAADMLEVAQHIEGTKSAEFKGGHRLQSGAVAIEYVETVAARAGAKGDLEIPARFKLAIAPFLGEQPVELWARFRYRIRGDKLVLGYLLERPEDVIRQSVDDIAQRLVATFGEQRVFVGTPRAA